MHRWILALAVVVGIAASQAWPQVEKTPSKDSQRISKLVGQLGSAKFSAREQARRELEAIGVPALEELRQAAKSPDLETSRRAAEIVRILEDKINTAKILGPRRVHLKLNNIPVLDAVKELAKQSRYSIQVQDDRKVLANRKVTLDTGATTFWEALDQLCAKAGLVETTPTPFAQPMLLPMQPARPIRIQPLPGGVLPVVPPAPAPGKKGPVFELQIGGAVEAVKVDPVGAAPKPVKEDAPAQPGKKIAPPAGQRVAPPLVLPIQVQPAQPIQIQFQFQPDRLPPVPYAANNGQITLTPGTPNQVPTYYAGAVRIRLLPSPEPKKAGETAFLLDVAAEPRLQNFALVGTPRIDKVSDDRGQVLSLVVGVPSQGNAGADVSWVGRNPYMSTRQATVRLKLGEKKAQSLKELKGSVSAQALTAAEPLITVKNILKAAGTTVKGAHGGSIQVKTIAKIANGDYQVQFRMEGLPGQNAFGGMMGGAIQVFPAGNVQIQQMRIVRQMRIAQMQQMEIGGLNTPGNGLPTLVDKDGKSYQLMNISERHTQFNGGRMTQEATLVFRAQNGQGEPDRLVLVGQRNVTFQVPFTFSNVKLP